MAVYEGHLLGFVRRTYWINESLTFLTLETLDLPHSEPRNTGQPSEATVTVPIYHIDGPEIGPEILGKFVEVTSRKTGKWYSRNLEQKVVSADESIATIDVLISVGEVNKVDYEYRHRKAAHQQYL